MSESKHTPGPWRVASATSAILAPSPSGKADRFIQVIYFDGDAYQYQSSGDALLIAAAPDLLAALKTLVAQIADYERVNNLAPNPGRSHCWDATVIAIDAIAKAEGKS